MTIRMRHTRAHRGNRRAHHSLTNAPVGACDYCNEQKLKHTICANCGRLKGKVIIDTTKKVAKKSKAGKEVAKA